MVANLHGDACLAVPYLVRYALNFGRGHCFKDILQVYTAGYCMLLGVFRAAKEEALVLKKILGSWTRRVSFIRIDPAGRLNAISIIWFASTRACIMR